MRHQWSSLTRLVELRRWQSARLARTYSDLERDPRYSKAVRFFLSNLYGAQDFTERDRQLLRASRYLRRALPRAARNVLEQAIALQMLTAQLDQAMAAVLPKRPITAERYALAYRAVGDRAARTRQIGLVVSIGKDLMRLIGRGRIGLLLHAGHVPAHALGFGVLQDFLERGFAAFREMSDAEPLLLAIEEREMQLMQALFSGDDSQLGQATMSAGASNG